MKSIIFIAIIFSTMFLDLKGQAIEYKYDKNGNRYQRKLYVCLNCPETERQSSQQSDQEAKNQQVANQLGLSVFPNPAQDRMAVIVKNIPDGEVASLIMIDEQGKDVLSKSISGQNEIDMTVYKAGIYFIKITVGKEVLQYKVVKLL